MVNENRLIKTFLEIVQIDSPTGYEGQMVKRICAKLSKLNISFNLDSYGNIIARFGTGQPVLLTAHLDTVEPGRGIKPIIKDRVIKSSGDTVLGADNKVAVAVILEALETLKEQDLNIPLEVVFTLSEEVANLGAVNLDYLRLKSKHGFSLDSEGAVGGVIIASPFYSRFDIEIVGKSAHASKPEDAINALSVMNYALNKIKVGRVNEDTVCNIGVVEGGSVRNTIPEKMLLRGEVRSFVQRKLEKAITSIKGSFISSANIFGARVAIDAVRENGGYKLDENDESIKFVVKTLKSLKIRPQLIKSYGCSDVNIFRDHGIKVLNLADGSKYSHTNNECISVNSLLVLSELVISLIMLK